MMYNAHPVCNRAWEHHDVDGKVFRLVEHHFARVFLDLVVEDVVVARFEHRDYLVVNQVYAHAFV